MSLILTKSKEYDNIDALQSEIKSIIRSNLGIRLKENLILDFMKNTDLSTIESVADILDSFYKFAENMKKDRIITLIQQENLKDGAYEFIHKSIDGGFVSHIGNELDDIMPPVSRREGAREKKKALILEKIKHIVEIFSLNFRYF